MEMFTIEEARKLLKQARVFFYNDDHDDEDSKWPQTLNMNDTWAWACSDGQYVTNKQLPEVAGLFWKYGNAGILYWVSKQTNDQRSEFYDNNRMIDFVAHEEKIRKEFPGSTERAYKKISYTIGE